MKSVNIPFLITALMLPALVFASTGAKEPEQINWAFDGVLGKMDKPSVQRGLQVYKEVCAACHGLKRVPFRSLENIGLSEAEAKAFAAEYTVTDGPNDDGEMFDRPGRPSDKFPSPYANDKAARAMQNGALPPDLSLIIKARPDGANYVHALLNGYSEAPAYSCEEVLDGKCVKFKHLSEVDAKVAEVTAEKAKEAEASDASDDDKNAADKDRAKTEEAATAPVEQTVGQLFRCSDIQHSESVDAKGKKTAIETCVEMGKTMHYNPYFPGKQIAMPAPLSDDQVTYQDDTKATREQMSRDVVNFLQWAAEPEMEARKRLGIKVIIFLASMTAFFWFTKKRIWSNLEH